MKGKIRNIGIVLLVLVWAALAISLWFGPRQDLSESERRPLAQAPTLTVKNFLSGKFFSDFEDFTLDQFPLRDGFRTVKSLFTYYVLQQKDNNGIYLHDGYAAKQEHALNPDSVKHVLGRFQHIYDKYLEDSNVYMAVVPDKGYYLAEQAGQLTLDHGALVSMLEAGMPWAQFVDLTGSLTLEDYYRTDSHWRQERLLPAAGALCEALGVAAPQPEQYTLQPLERPFYGVYVCTASARQKA